MANRKTWLAILIALFVIAGLAAIGVVAGSAYWISRHVTTEAASADAAEAEFRRERLRFAGQQPLVEIRGDRENPTVHKIADATGPEHPELQTLHAHVFTPESGKITRVDIPFWLLRFGNGLRFMDDMGAVTLEDLERHGPGLIVNGTGEDGQLILVWIE
jgi:hypothetical protein